MAPDEVGYVTRPSGPLSVFLSPKMYFPDGKYSQILSHYPEIVAVLNDRKSVDAFLSLPPRAQLKFFDAEPIFDKKNGSIIGWKDKPAVALGKTILEDNPELSHWLAAVPYPDEPEEEDAPPPPPPPSDGENSGTPYDLIPRPSFHPEDDDDDDFFDFKP